MHIEEMALKILNKYISFTHSTRVMMLIDRGIKNNNKGSKRWVNKLISCNSTGFHENLLKLLELQHYINNPDIRLYSCVNARKLDKSINHFMHKQLDLQLNTAIQINERIRFYINLNDQFCSSLMKPENRDSNYFLIDLDTKHTSELDNYIDTLEIEVNLKYETVKGWHYITDPFNPILLHNLNDCEVKKDALILLNYLGNN